MRRTRLLLILLSLVVAALALFLFLKFRHRSQPTPFNWRASIITIAGNGAPSFAESIQPLQAGLSDPFGVVVGQDGAIFIADAGESNRIRSISNEGMMTTLAGGNEGFADGSGAQASFNSPSGLAIDHAGNIFVADTGNNRVRKVTPEGVVSTIAGNGTAGYVDGQGASAEFNGPIGVAVDGNGNVFVADTYNDRIRKIAVSGEVTTVAGGNKPGYADGDGPSSLFDTPCGIVAYPDGSLMVADSGNNRLRKIAYGRVSTLSLTGVSDDESLRKPEGLALTHDGFLYCTESDRARIIQIAPDGKVAVMAGNGPGFADGHDSARFNQPAGLAIDPRNGDLLVADSANYLVRKLTAIEMTPTESSPQPLPRITSETIGEKFLRWPVNPQDRPHEVVATVGEVRGTYESNDSRDHLHSGLDVAAAFGEVVRVIRPDKVSNPLPNWGFESLSEGLRVGIVSYIHMRVGRDKDSQLFGDQRFIPVSGDDGKLIRIRVKRGTRFRVGDGVGTVNRMYHVHLIVGPSGAEINPLSLSPLGFVDTIAPTIEKDGIKVLDESGQPLKEMDHGRVVVRGRVRIVVDAFDRYDMNSDRRRLGLYSLGYQVLSAKQVSETPPRVDVKTKQTDSANLTPAPGFEHPRINILFNRLPWGAEAPKLAYTDQSGITVYGSKTTRFLYEISNIVKDGHASPGFWNSSELPKGNYMLRVIARDFSGNEATENRDLPIEIR